MASSILLAQHLDIDWYFVGKEPAAKSIFELVETVEGLAQDCARLEECVGEWDATEHEVLGISDILESIPTFACGDPESLVGEGPGAYWAFWDLVPGFSVDWDDYDEHGASMTSSVLYELSWHGTDKELACLKESTATLATQVQATLKVLQALQDAD